jgi:hypothetical protein
VCENEWFHVSEVLVFENTLLTLTKPLLFEVLILSGLHGGFERTIAKHWALPSRNEPPKTSGFT